MNSANFSGKISSEIPSVAIKISKLKYLFKSIIREFHFPSLLESALIGFTSFTKSELRCPSVFNFPSNTIPHIPSPACATYRVSLYIPEIKNKVYAELDSLESSDFYTSHYKKKAHYNDSYIRYVYKIK